MDERDWMADGALVEAARRGDRDAAARLYYRHIDRVHRICYRIVLDPAQAPDCVQEVWLKVFRSLGRFRSQNSFAAWLNSITANTAIDYYRRHRRQGGRVELGEAEMESLPADGRSVDQQLDGALMQQRIRDALEQISETQRAAFVLRYFEDMSLPEIARTLGCREGTVRTHIRRCVLALRDKLAAGSTNEGTGIWKIHGSR